MCNFGACKKSEYPGMELKLFEEIQLKDLEPGMITSGAATSACESGRRPEMKPELFGEMQRRAWVQCDHIQRG